MLEIFSPRPSNGFWLLDLSCVGLLVAMKFVCCGSGGACEDAD